MTTPQTYINQAKERRAELKAISQPLKQMVASGQYATLNEAIIATVYKSEDNKVFKTFEQWKSEGFSVKKGARAFAVWGKPQPLKNAEPRENGEEREFFPVCYLFSNSQVIRRDTETKVEEPEGQYMAFREIQVRYSTTPQMRINPNLSTSRDVVDALRPLYLDCMEHKEKFIVVFLNRSNRMLGYSVISIGGMSGTVVDPKVVFQCALLANASGMVLCHNHPSGSLKPSQADIDLTKKLTQAGKVMDLFVLDHVILTEESYLSFADEGLM